MEINLYGKEVVFVGEEDGCEKVFWHIAYSATYMSDKIKGM